MAAPLICVVEDEATIAAAVAAHLRAEGFDVEVASDGPSGVALCHRVRPDLVVLDVMRGCGRSCGASTPRPGVDSHVRGLRAKLGPGLVRTVHGVGYALEA